MVDVRPGVRELLLKTVKVRSVHGNVQVFRSPLPCTYSWELGFSTLIATFNQIATVRAGPFRVVAAMNGERACSDVCDWRVVTNSHIRTQKRAKASLCAPLQRAPTQSAARVAVLLPCKFDDLALLPHGRTPERRWLGDTAF